MHKHSSIEQFTADLAARTPTPGGGSASAVAGALGAALGSMSAAFTTQNERFRAVEPQVLEIRAKLEARREHLLALIDRDVEAYRALVEARRLPKETPELKEKRERSIEAAQEQATRVPEEILEHAAEALGLVNELTPLCNPRLLTDAAAAAHLLEAAARGAAAQVLGNLGPATGSAGAERRKRSRRTVQRCEEQRLQIERAILKALDLPDDT